MVASKAMKDIIKPKLPGFSPLKIDLIVASVFTLIVGPTLFSVKVMRRYYPERRVLQR
jgi:hypothetical protein